MCLCAFGAGTDGLALAREVMPMKYKILTLLVVVALAIPAITQQVTSTGSTGSARTLLSNVNATVSSTTTLAFSSAAIHTIQNVAFGASNISSLTASSVPVGTVTIIFTQDSVGGRIITSWDSTIFKFAGGTRPTLTTTANAVDMLEFICNGSVCRLKAATYDVR